MEVCLESVRFTIPSRALTPTSRIGLVTAALVLRVDETHGAASWRATYTCLEYVPISLLLDSDDHISKRECSLLDELCGKLFSADCIHYEH